MFLETRKPNPEVLLFIKSAYQLNYNLFSRDDHKM